MFIWEDFGRRTIIAGGIPPRPGPDIPRPGPDIPRPGPATPRPLPGPGALIPSSNAKNEQNAKKYDYITGHQGINIVATVAIGVSNRNRPFIEAKFWVFREN
jgi:hypothetical protein